MSEVEAEVPVSKPLFTITEAMLDTGLRGFPVGTVRTSHVTPDLGVTYLGYPVEDLKDLPGEDVVYLLFHKALPTKEQAATFKADLAKRCVIDPAVFAGLKALPKKGHPMEWFLAAINLLGMTGKTGDYREDCLNIIARITSVTAAVYRIREGLGDPIAPRHDLPLHENFVHMLGMKQAHPILPDLLRLFYVLHMDHGGGNLSTFVGKAVASGKADMYSSIVGAMAALYGPRHGRANQECLEFVKLVGVADPKAAEAKVRAILKGGGLVFGFGHAVLRAEDPRAKIQYDFAKKHFPNDPLLAIAHTLRGVVPPILKENPKIANPYPNVDAVSGSLMTAAGLTDPEYYTLLFGWSRVAGIACQIVDERIVKGKKDGFPIYRPKYLPVDQPAKRLQPQGAPAPAAVAAKPAAK